MIREIRYAIRQLAKRPGFTLVSALTLGLGIGANTAIFSVVNALLLRPLPYPHSEQLVLLRERSETFESGSVSYPNYLDWRAAQRGFTDLALFRRDRANLSARIGEANPERIGAARVTWNFFGILGLPPKLGRDFAEGDDLPGSRKVVLITSALWQRRFAGSRDVLGQQITIDGTSREIIGVVSEKVGLPRLAEVYLPMDELRAEDGVLRRGNHPGFSVLGRLKAGVTLAQAADDMNNIARDLAQRYPEEDAGRTVSTRILLEFSVADYRQSVWLLFAAVACVLLIACANVANLQLSQALNRTRELAVRAALGASRSQLVRQLLIESVVLVLLGGVLAVLFSLWSLDAIIALSPRNVPRFHETRIDLVALAFTAAVVAVASLLIGLWPALRISRVHSLSLELHQGAGRAASEGLSRQRIRALLVVAQMALALILLAAAGLTLKSFWRAQNAPLGFDPHGVLTMNLSLPKARYPTDESIAAFNAQLIERVGALPGVSAAAIGANIPFDDTEWDSYVHVTGTPEPEHGKEPSAEINIVSPDYFRVIGMSILRGRAFGPQDTYNGPRGTQSRDSFAGIARAVIVDDSFVRKFFPGKDPIGQQVDDNQSPKEKHAPPLTVIGVVPRTRNEAPGENNVEKFNFPQMYLCSAQCPQDENTLLVRVAQGDPLAMVNVIKHEVQTLDPDQPVASISTMEGNIASSLAARRLIMTLLGAFAGLALVLASVGLYGVMALSVTQRTRELGIRMALGAARYDVFRLVLSHGAWLICIGIVLGLIGAIAASHVLQAVLYNVGALDLPAFAIAIGALAFIALFACFLPARRASRVDPIVALRED
jgi:putative ABC transport system permease protein